MGEIPWLVKCPVLESCRADEISAPPWSAAFPSNLLGRTSRVIANATRARCISSPVASGIWRLRRRWRSPTAPGNSKPGDRRRRSRWRRSGFHHPEHIRAAATEAMNAGDTHYVASAGIPSSAQGDRRQASHRQWHRGRPERRRHRHPRGETSALRSHARLCRAGVDVMIPEPAWVSYGPNGGARRRYGCARAA